MDQKTHVSVPFSCSVLNTLLRISRKEHIMNDKFKKLIEYIVNEDETRARELFHEIVVEKSREIYESMMDDEEEDLDENFGAYEGDASDDMISDVEDDIDSDHEGMDDASDELDSEMDMDDEQGEMGGDEELEDRVVDLEDALDSLKAEFEELMKGEEGEEEHDEMGDEDMEDMGDEDMEDMDDEDMEDEEESDEDEEDLDEVFMREYREKAPQPVKSEVSGTNTKSTVAGKNDMGGTAKNLVQGGEAKGRTAPSAKTQTDAADPRDFKTGAGPKPVRSEVGGINKTAPIGSK